MHALILQFTMKSFFLLQLFYGDIQFVVYVFTSNGDDPTDL